MTLGQRMKFLREERKITQMQLSKYLNVSNSTLSLYESDSRKPDYEVLRKMAALFEVSTDYLLGLTNISDVKLYDTSVSYSFDVSKLPDEAISQISSYIEYIREKYEKYDKCEKKKPLY